MANIVIKKRISLDYLGEEYAKGYIDFKSISIREVEAKIDELEAVGEDNKQALKIMIELLEKQFITGQFFINEKSEEITKEDIKDFDVNSIMKFFGVLSGKEGDLKV